MFESVEQEVLHDRILIPSSSKLELGFVEAMIMGDRLDAPRTRPALKSKEEGVYFCVNELYSFMKLVRNK